MGEGDKVIFFDFTKRLRRAPEEKEEEGEALVEIEPSREVGFRKKVLEGFFRNQKKIMIIRKWLEETERNPALKKRLQQELEKLQSKQDDVAFGYFRSILESNEIIGEEDHSVNQILCQALLLDLERRIK